MADTKIRLAVIGTGPRWLDLAKVYMNNPVLDVVAVCDTAEGAAEEAAKQLHDNFGCNPKVFTKYEDMAKNACYDAVFISCDPDIQVNYACREMERGIHVMTEVPAAYTIDECHALVNTVKKTGVKYQLAEQTRYWDFIRKWREMAERGKFGNIFYAEGEYLHFEEKWDFFRNKKTGHRIWTNDKSLHRRKGLARGSLRRRLDYDPRAPSCRQAPYGGPRPAVRISKYRGLYDVNTKVCS